MGSTGHAGIRSVGALCAALAAASCDGTVPNGDGSQGLPGPASGVTASPGPALSLELPGELARARAIELDVLEPSVTFDGRPVAVRRGGAGGWVASGEVAGAGTLLVTVSWIERFEGEPLTLASWSGEFDTDREDAVRVGPGDYDLGHDQDRDTLSNLVERRDGSDPRDPDDPIGVDAPPVGGAPDDLVNPAPRGDALILPALGGTRIDGAWSDDGFWGQATGRNRTFAIDRLPIDAGTGAGEGDRPAHRWTATHDGTWFYVYVVYAIPADALLQPDSGGSFEADNALSVFFDPELDGGTTLRGAATGENAGGDVHFVIPLRPTSPDEKPEAFAPRASAPRLPDSLEYGVCPCSRPGNEGGWELRVRLDDIGVEIGEPFGFEVQIDQDFDGGARDARWGWSVPDAGTLGNGPVPVEAPALHGSVTLVPNG